MAIFELITPPAAALIGDCLLDSEALGEVLGLDAQAIRLALHRGRFPIRPIKLGRRLRFRATDVRRYIETGEAAGSAAPR
jgi:predicted DNA-binding transcriptional regulator AlpA